MAMPCPASSGPHGRIFTTSPLGFAQDSNPPPPQSRISPPRGSPRPRPKLRPSRLPSGNRPSISVSRPRRARAPAARSPLRHCSNPLQPSVRWRGRCPAAGSGITRCHGDSREDPILSPSFPPAVSTEPADHAFFSCDHRGAGGAVFPPLAHPSALRARPALDARPGSLPVFSGAVSAWHSVLSAELLFSSGPSCRCAYGRLSL